MVAYSSMSWPVNENSNITIYHNTLMLLLKITWTEVSHLNLSSVEFWYFFLLLKKESDIFCQQVVVQSCQSRLSLLPLLGFAYAMSNCIYWQLFLKCPWVHVVPPVILPQCLQHVSKNWDRSKLTIVFHHCLSATTFVLFKFWKYNSIPFCFTTWHTF